MQQRSPHSFVMSRKVHRNLLRIISVMNRVREDPCLLYVRKPPGIPNLVVLKMECDTSLTSGGAERTYNGHDV